MATTRPRGANRDSFDARDLIYRPALVDLKPEVLPHWDGIRVLHQGQEGACTGFALAAMINYLLFQRGERNQVSARMLFEMAKRYDQWPGNRYDWSSARGAMKGWYKHGVCGEADWPNAEADDRELTLERQKKALRHPLGTYYRILPRRTDVHAALSEVGVVFAAAATHAGWFKPRNGRIELTDTGEPTGHAFAIVGYTDEGLIVQNSWGPTWGGVKLGGKLRQGLAIWSHEDFERHAWDLWVARLARPVESLEALRSEYTSGNQGSRKSSSGPPPHEVSRHLIHIDDGQFDERSEYASTDASAQALIETKVDAAAGRNDLALLLYAHGGLNTVDEVARRVRAWRDVLDANHVEHAHWLWETGFLAELKDVVFGKDRIAAQITGGAGDWKDKALEVLARPLGKALWDEIKRDANLAFQPGGAGERVLGLFGQAQAKAGPIATRRITLAGHSAGAIWVGETLDAWSRLEPGFHVDQVVLLAPACRVDFFLQKIAPHVVAGRVGKLTVFQLTDELERDDDVASVYGKSILYFVSNAFEERQGETPILGLQKFNPAWQPIRDQLNALGRLTLHTAGVDRDASRATTHSGFDNDETTLNALLKIALGERPVERGFSKADLI